MIGVLICINDFDSNILRKLFKGIDFSNYIFDTDYIESYETDMPDDWVYFSQLEDISSEQAKVRILEVDQMKCAIEFLELNIRPCFGKKYEIELYSDFISSDYVISVIITDHRNVEICCKKPEWLSFILKNAYDYGGKNRIITITPLLNINPKSKLRAWRVKGDISIYDDALTRHDENK